MYVIDHITSYVNLTKIRRVRNAAQWEKLVTHTQFESANLKLRFHLRHLEAYRRIILKWILKEQDVMFGSR
jgi:hypothetical protein